MRERASAIILSVLLLSLLCLVLDIRPVHAAGTVYIRTDGSIDPPTAPIERVGNVYTLTDDIYDSIVVERDNIVLDGAGFALGGSGTGAGVNLADMSNVTIEHLHITGFYYGVWLSSSYGCTLTGNNITANVDSGVIIDFGPGPTQGSSYNNIVYNSIANNGDGIYLDYPSNRNNVSSNHVAANNWHGITLGHSQQNTLYGNKVTQNGYFGIWLNDNSNTTLRSNIMVKNRFNFQVDGWPLERYLNDIDASNTVDGKPIYYWINKRDMTVPLDAGYVALINCTNIKVRNLNLENDGQGLLLAGTNNSTITQNNMANNAYGIWLDLGNSNNSIYHNNFLGNCATAYTSYYLDNNVWDVGYPLGGNYWSDYTGMDQYKGPYQNETGGDGIGDVAYVIDSSNTDKYPLMKPFTPMIGDINNDFKVDIKDLATAALAFGSYPGRPRWNPQADINQDFKIDIRDLVLIAKDFGKSWP